MIKDEAQRIAANSRRLDCTRRHDYLLPPPSFLKTFRAMQCSVEHATQQYERAEFCGGAGLVAQKAHNSDRSNLSTAIKLRKHEVGW
jgi:hypothetical protein